MIALDTIIWSLTPHNKNIYEQLHLYFNINLQNTLYIFSLIHSKLLDKVLSCTYTIHIDVCFCPSSTTNVFQNQSWNNDVCHPSVKISYSDLKKPNNKGPSFRIVLLLTICEYFLTFRSAIHCLFHTPLKVVASCTCKSTLTLDKYMSKHFEPNGGHRLI